MATQYLFRSEAPHVCALEEMFQVVTEVGDVGVHCDLRGEGGGKEREGERYRERTEGGNKKEEKEIEREKGDGRVIPTPLPRGKEGEGRGNITVLHPTLFSHSNSAHIFLNSASVHEAGWM